MSGFLLDTNIISETMRPKPDKAVLRWFQIQKLDALFLSTITIGELWQGVHQLSANHPKLAHYQNSIAFVEDQYDGRILPFDQNAARLWGQLRGQQKLLGRILPELDLQIAAIAAHHHLTIVTANTKHFTGLGLAVLNPKDLHSNL